MVLALETRDALIKKRKRVGRGGSRGGTSGRGHKGQKSRAGGGVSVIFEGGQMPLTRRLPKRGFNNKPFQTEWVVINVGRLNEIFADGDTVSREQFVEHGIVGLRNGARVKVLGHGELKKRLKIEADAFSKTAIEAIKKQGGEVHLLKEK